MQLISGHSYYHPHLSSSYRLHSSSHLCISHDGQYDYSTCQSRCHSFYSAYIQFKCRCIRSDSGAEIEAVLGCPCDGLGGLSPHPSPELSEQHREELMGRERETRRCRSPPDIPELFPGVAGPQWKTPDVSRLVGSGQLPCLHRQRLELCGGPTKAVGMAYLGRCDHCQAIMREDHGHL